MPLHLQLPVKALSSNLDIDIAFINFEVAPDFTTSCSSSSKIQPVACWMSGTAGHDIHDLAAFQLVIQRHHACHKPLAIAAAALGDDASACTTGTYLRVNSVSKIKRSRPNRKAFALPFSLKDKNPFL